MAELLVETPEGITLRYELAGPGTRTAAGVMDLMVLFLLWIALYFALMFLAEFDVTGISGFATGLLVGGALVIPAVYQIGFGVFDDGRSLGKRMFRVRAADVNGGSASAIQHVLRGLFWPLEAIVLVFPIPVGLILMTASERSQRLGDVVAGTVVLRDVKRAAVADPFPRHRYKDLASRRLPLVLAHAARLEASDLALLRELLGRSDVKAEPRRRLQRQAARRYLERLGLDDLPDGSLPDPRQVLLEIYLFLRDHRTGGPAATPRPKAPDRDGAAGDPDSAPAAAASPR